MDIELSCMHDADDRISVERDSDGEIAFRSRGSSVFATDEDARGFARKILALVGDEAKEPTPAPIRVGDLVEILQSRHNTTSAGRTGAVSRIDVHDTELPYRIVEPGTGKFVAWASQVRKVDAPSSTDDDARGAFVSRAKFWLAGTEHTAADIVRLAEFLAA